MEYFHISRATLTFFSLICFHVQNTPHFFTHSPRSFLYVKSYECYSRVVVSAVGAVAAAGRHNWVENLFCNWKVFLISHPSHYPHWHLESFSVVPAAGERDLPSSMSRTWFKFNFCVLRNGISRLSHFKLLWCEKIKSSKIHCEIVWMLKLCKKFNPLSHHPTLKL